MLRSEVGFQRWEAGEEDMPRVLRRRPNPGAPTSLTCLALGTRPSSTLLTPLKIQNASENDEALR